MKLLFCERNMLMQRDMEEALHRMNIFFRCASYVFSNPDSDDYYCSHLKHFLKEDSYDAVFSFNFIPVIADVCHEMELPYLVWTYDAGWECGRTDAFFYPTNHIFHFDKTACTDYRSRGYHNIFHLPLAVNCHRLDARSDTPAQAAASRSDVAFVGNLYENYDMDTYPLLRELPSDLSIPLKEFLLKQIPQYTNHHLWELLTDAYTAELLSSRQEGFLFNRTGLIAACAGMISYEQRKYLLNLISGEFPLTLYSYSNPELVPNAQYAYRAYYYEQMPRIFKYAAVNLNFTLPSIQTGMPLRMLDVLGAGGFLITNEQEELYDHFQVGRDLEIFRSSEELMDKIRFYRKHRDEAARIAENGHAVVRQDFSFEKQFAKILEQSGLHLL